MSDTLGTLVRLWGITTAQLPPAGATADDLAPFLISILQEAVPFIDPVAPKNPDLDTGAQKLWKFKGSKPYPGSDAKVENYERVVSVADLEMLAARNLLPHGAESRIPAETWACRRSVHEDAAKSGTASWTEFVECFKIHHAEAEEEFVPTVIGAREAIVWNCDGVEAEEGGERWSDFTLKVEEVKHNIGTGLKNRTFPVLQMTCSAMGTKEFLVVSVSVTDFGSSPDSQYSKEKGVVVGAYSSIERIRKLPVTGDIEWIMATTSNARGVLPMWVQAMAVPGQIAKDVPLFLTWVAKERAGAKGSKKEEKSSGKPEKKKKDDKAEKEEKKKKEREEKLDRSEKKKEKKEKQGQKKPTGDDASHHGSDAGTDADAPPAPAKSDSKIATAKREVKEKELPDPSLDSKEAATKKDTTKKEIAEPHPGTPVQGIEE
jgi:hypothetical protein